MPTPLRLCLITAFGLLMAAATAQAQGIYRCGSSYGTAPCPGGAEVAADDSRTPEQRQQALAAKKQDAQLARQLAAERRAREQAAAGQRAARIGPSQAEQARADAVQTKAETKARTKAAAKRSKSGKPRKLGTA